MDPTRLSAPPRSEAWFGRSGIRRAARFTVGVVTLILLTTVAPVRDAVAQAPGTCQGRTVTIEGTPGDDVLSGTSGPD